MNSYNQHEISYNVRFSNANLIVANFNHLTEFLPNSENIDRIFLNEDIYFNMLDNIIKFNICDKIYFRATLRPRSSRKDIHHIVADYSDYKNIRKIMNILAFESDDMNKICENYRDDIVKLINDDDIKKIYLKDEKLFNIDHDDDFELTITSSLFSIYLKEGYYIFTIDLHTNTRTNSWIRFSNQDYKDKLTVDVNGFNTEIDIERFLPFYNLNKFIQNLFKPKIKSAMSFSDQFLIS